MTIPSVELMSAQRNATGSLQRNGGWGANGPGRESTEMDCAQNYYEFTTVAPFEAFRPERPSRRNPLKLKKVRVVPAGGIEPTA
jgi:hypothetical protein